MKTEEDFLQFAGPLPEPMFLLARSGGIRAANPAAAAMLRRPQQELAGRDVAEFVNDAAPKVHEYLASCARSPQLTAGSLNWCNAAGEIVPTRAECALIHAADAVLLRCRPKDASITPFVALNEKIAERRQAEERLQSILDNSAAIICLKDTRGRYVLVNRRFEDVFGVPHAAGKTDAELFPGETAERLRANDLAVLETGKAMEFEESFPGGRTFLSVKFPVPAGLGTIATDITERKRLDEQLRDTQKLESLGVLAGGIAHDFNNLLTGILGNASVALDAIPAGCPAQNSIQDVIEAGERAAHLTRQMLAYAGKGRFLKESTDLSALVRGISNLIRSSVAKGVELRLDLARNLTAIEADPGQIQQLVMNLVINGAEAIGEDRVGTVHVLTGAQEVDAEYIRINFAPGEIEPGPYVFLEVHDTGTGMDEGTRSRIFEPFFTTKFTGRGLGLAAVQGIVRGHKGAIRVYSTPGRGTTFKVLLPAFRESQPAQAGAAGGIERRISGAGTILVVDDEDIVRRTAKNMLERFGYTVLLAENGQQAVEVFRQDAGGIALVLLDLTMPVMGGEEAFRNLNEIRPEVKVLLSSGYNEVEAIRRFTGRGVAGFIQKPYTAARLAEKVKQVLGVAA